MAPPPPPKSATTSTLCPPPPARPLSNTVVPPPPSILRSDPKAPTVSSDPAVDNPMEAPQAPPPLQGGSMWARDLAIVHDVFGPPERNNPQKKYKHNSNDTCELLKMVHNIPEDFASVGGWMKLHMSLVGKDKSELHYRNFFKTMAAEPILKLIGGYGNVGSCHPDLYTFGPGWIMGYHQAHFTARSTKLNSRLNGYNPTVIPFNLGVPLPTWGQYDGSWYCPLCKKEHDQDSTIWVNPDAGGTEKEPWPTTHRGKALKHKTNCNIRTYSEWMNYRERPSAKPWYVNVNADVATKLYWHGTNLSTKPLQM